MHRRFHALLLATTALVPCAAALAAGPAPPGATELPTGPQTQGGSATYTTNNGTNTLTVNQSSQNLITNWNTFNIGSSATVTFAQPNASAIALNRVTGDTNASQIMGTLSANGIVFLVNPNGFIFGKGSQVNASGFLATTHDIKNSDFMAGKYNFTIPGNPTASIVNFGNITATATSGGFAALVAPGVRNDGVITAQLGTVGLASSGQGFTLDMYGDKLITLGVSDQVASQVLDVSTGLPLSVLVANNGTLSANGGKVQITAAAAKIVVDSVINNQGVIEANTVAQRGGTIVLAAATAKSKPSGAPAQNVKLAGTISAAGKNARQTGGTIKVTGENISMTGAKLDASGQAGGGSVMVGLDVPIFNQYMTPASTASTVTIDNATTIDVSATGTNGHGGQIALWSDLTTKVDGSLIGTGGSLSGGGGQAFVVGATTLMFNGTSNLADGNNNSSNSNNNDDRLLLISGNDVTIVQDPSGLPAGASYVTTSALQNSLANNSVSVNAGIGTIAIPPFGPTGNITIASGFSWDSASSLRLQANQNITVNDGVTIKNNSVNLDTTIVGQELSLDAGKSATGVGTVNFLGSANIDLSNSYASAHITYNPTGGYASPTNFSQWITPSPFLGGANQPSALSAAMLVNTATDLQNISQNLSGNYQLSQNIDASSIANFVPIGTLDHPFTGSLNGGDNNGNNGNTISNLTINASGTGAVGLFGVIGQSSFNCTGACSFGWVSNINLVNASVTANGASAVGALAGTNYGSIWQSSVTGSVSRTGEGEGSVGGLIGRNFGSITSSSSGATVTVGNFANAGGLVGYNDTTGLISSSLSTGSVTGGANSNVGGLAGANAGWIQDTYAIGPVTGGSNSVVGGLVGFLAGSGSCDCGSPPPGGSIAISWASGAVSAVANSSNVTTGGLVGAAGNG
jgi:filamentous hemagglutinin family protein